MQITTTPRRVQFEAYVGEQLDFWNYLRSYQHMFNLGMAQVDNGQQPIDRVAYPLLFMARHTLELGFKANIRYFQRYSDKTDFTNSDSHHLKPLFEGFKLHIRAAIKNLSEKYGITIAAEDIQGFDVYCRDVEQLTDLFMVLDAGSFSFRYPVDTKNKPVFECGTTVNLLDIQDLFDKAMILLWHTADVFSPYTDYADDLDAALEDEMQSLYGNYYS